ncbi:MAG: PAS domain S-box protein [Bacteroidales bacterium]|nr:PAS domain S-box protein [Bacteroidales bacterium]MCF8404538.1 PAS domain S-box protein [Bacteroidales bacterium]
MRREVPFVSIVTNSVKQQNFIKDLFYKNGSDISYKFHLSFIVTRSVQKVISSDLLAIYLGANSNASHPFIKSLFKSKVDKLTPVLLLAHRFDADLINTLDKEFPMIDFISLTASTENLIFKIQKMLNTSTLLAKSINISTSKENNRNIKYPGSYALGTESDIHSLLTIRTRQLVSEICDNIRLKVSKNSSNPELNMNGQFISSLLKTIPNPIYFKNQDGCYVGCNRAFENLVGLTNNEIIGKTANDFLLPAVARKIVKQDKIILKENSQSYEEFNASFQNGKNIDVVLYRNVFTLDEKKNNKGLFGIIIDISPQRQAEKFIQIQHDIDFHSWSKGNLKNSMQYILNKLKDIDWLDGGGIYLFNREKTVLSLICHSGLSKQFIENTSIFTEEAAQVSFIRKKESYFGNFAELMQFIKYEDNSEGIGAITVLPLINGDEVIGSINLFSKNYDQVPENDRIALRSIAAKIAIIVAYMKARDEIEQAKQLLESKVEQRTKELAEVNKNLLQEIAYHKRTKNSLNYSENLYRTIFDNAQDGIALFEAESLRIIDCNPQVYRDLEYPKEEFLKLKYKDFTVYDAHQNEFVFQNLILKNRKFSGEVKFKTRSNRIKYKIVNANLIEIYEKNYILAIIHDVTRLYLAKFELKQKDEKIKALQENVSVGLFRINPKGLFIYANSYIAEMLGEASKEIIMGSNLLDYVSNREIIKKVIKEMNKNGEINNYELEIKRQDNSNIWASLNVKGIEDEYGRLNYYDGYIEDITEIKIIQTKLQKANKEIRIINKDLKSKIQKAVLKEKKQQAVIVQKSKLESLGELAAGIAHEINQPLGIMSLTFENLQARLNSGNFDSKYVDRKLNSIFANINRIRDIIDHIRIFSRDQGSVMMQKVNINEVIFNILKLINTQYKNNNIYIELNLDDNIGFTVGSKLKLEQVLLNLLSNAKHALEAHEMENGFDGLKKKIKITTELNKNRIYLGVEDNGTGMDSGTLEKVFDPFFTTKPAMVGTGLGLSIVYGIIKEMNGEISVESQVNEFTRFQILLPRFPEKV